MKTYKQGLLHGRQESGIFIIIPHLVLSNPNLTANAKLLYGEILALTKKSGKCYATNAHLAKTLGLSDRSITSIIQQLVNLPQPLITVTLSTSKKGTYRGIRILPTHPHMPIPTEQSTQKDEEIVTQKRISLTHENVYKRENTVDNTLDEKLKQKTKQHTPASHESGLASHEAKLLTSFTNLNDKNDECTTKETNDIISELEIDILFHLYKQRIRDSAILTEQGIKECRSSLAKLDLFGLVLAICNKSTDDWWIKNVGNKRSFTRFMRRRENLEEYAQENSQIPDNLNNDPKYIDLMTKRKKLLNEHY